MEPQAAHIISRCHRCADVYASLPNALQPPSFSYLCPKCQRALDTGGVCYVKVSDSAQLDPLIFRPDDLVPRVPSSEQAAVVEQALARELLPSIRAPLTRLAYRYLPTFLLRSEGRHLYQAVACNQLAALNEHLMSLNTAVLMHYSYDSELLLRPAESVAASELLIALWTATTKSSNNTPELHLDFVLTEALWSRLTRVQRETLKYLQVQVEELLRAALPTRVFSGARHAARVELVSLDARIELNGRSVLQRRWFIPGDYALNTGRCLPQQLTAHGFDSGVTTYEGLFTVQELDALEWNIDNNLIAAPRHALGGHTADYTELHGQLARTKYFFGAGYGYGKKGGAIGKNDSTAGIFVDVEAPPMWLRELAEWPLICAGMIPSTEWLDSWAINVYHNGILGLAQHFDDVRRFEQPIFSIRLYSDSRLTFDAHGQPMLNPLCCVPMPRGCVTVLEQGGFAANRVTHCIRPQDMSGKSAAIILRRMQLAALLAARVANATMGQQQQQQ